MRYIRRVLFKRGDLAGHPVRHLISCACGCGSRKTYSAKVQQIGKKHRLIESELSTKEEGVFALGHVDHVAQLIVVRTRERTGVRRGRAKVPVGKSGQC